MRHKMPAATTPGLSNGNSTRVKSRMLFAPKTFAAFSTSGEICSTKGTVIRITSGKAGNEVHQNDGRETPVQTEPIHHGGELHGVGHRWQDDRQQHSKHESRFARKVLARKHVSGWRAGGKRDENHRNTHLERHQQRLANAHIVSRLAVPLRREALRPPSGSPVRRKGSNGDRAEHRENQQPETTAANQVITLVTVTRENHRLANGRGVAGRADRDVEVMALSVSTRCRAAVDPVTHRD